jgi:transposase
VSQARKNIDKKLKARVAMDAIRGEKTIAMIVSEYEVQPNQVSLWKKKLIDGLPDLFEDKRKKESRENDFQKREDELHRQLGKAQAELEWLKKKSIQLGL